MHRRASFTVTLLTCFGSSCGFDTVPVPASDELGEVCGQTTPLRIFEAPSHDLHRAWQADIIEERRILHVRHTGAPDNHELWSVGLCGEDPRQLDAGFDYYWPNIHDALPSVCDRERGEVRVVDPSGERSSHAVFTTDSCFFTKSTAGLVELWPDAEGSSTGALVLHPWPEDVWTDVVEPITLLDGVYNYNGSANVNPWQALQGSEHEVFVRTVDDKLVRVSVEDGDVELIASDVRAFDLGYEPVNTEFGYARRYLMWQRLEVSNDGEEPEGEVLLLDRETDELRSLGETALAYAQLSPFNWSASGLLQLPFPDGDGLTLRVYQLPSLDYVEVPGSTRPLHMLDDDRHLVVTLEKGGPLAILDTQTGEMQVFEGQPDRRFWHASRVLSILPKGEDAHSELWLVDDGSPPELLAERATYYHAFMPEPDGRVVSVVDLDEHEEIGDLIWVDPETLVNHRIDQGVFGSGLSTRQAVEGDATVVYMVPRASAPVSGWPRCPSRKLALL